MRHKSFFKTIWLCGFLSCYGLLSHNLISKAETKQSSPLEYNQQNQVCIQDLESTIDNIIQQQERRKETWGILVENIDDNQILYRLNEDKYFIPASNAKLLTTAAFLLKLGEDFTINTPVYIKKKDKIIEELIIWGKSDPSLAKSDLETIAKKIKELNINYINKITLIENKIAEYPVNGSWEFSDLYFSYAVPVNSLILDGNTVTLTISPSQVHQTVILTWSNELAGKQWLIMNEGVTVNENEENTISLNPLGLEAKLKITGNLPINNGEENWQLAIPNPSQYFQDSLMDILAENQIKIGEVNILKEGLNFNLDKFDLLLEFQSPNSQKLITITNQDSNNLYAEILLNYLTSDEDDKFISQKKILGKLGISENNYTLKDGSGLSRQNLVTPQGLVTLLKLMAKTNYGDTFRNSLSLAGVNGTLKNRFQNDDTINGNLWAKTGTLTGVSALSGYLYPYGKDRLIFSIIVNNSSSKGKDLRATIDNLVRILANLEKCS